MKSEQDKHTPLQIWKLVLLFLATASLYQFVWLYRIAEDLKKSRDASITPWHWAAAPLLGPLMIVPAYYLASYLKNWQVEEGREVGHMAEPVLVAMMILIAYLPFFMLIVEISIISTVVITTSLLLCLPYLALQGQVNLNRNECSDTSWAFVRHQKIGMAVGIFLAVPLYAYTFTDIWVRHGSSALTLAEIVGPEGGFFQVRVMDAEWTQINAGNLADDSNLEFLGPDEWTWAVVYEYRGLNVDAVMSYRVESVKEDYRSATCKQMKSLVPQSLVVVGTVECTGRNILEGSYVLVARVLVDKSNAVEIVAFTSQNDRDRYDELAPRVRKFADGLELTL